MAGEWAARRDGREVIASMLAGAGRQLGAVQAEVRPTWS